MGIMGPTGAWSLGTAPGDEPVRPQSPLRVTISAGNGRPPIRRASKSLPASPLHAHFAGSVAGGGISPGSVSDAVFEARLQQMLLEKERRRFDASSSHSRSASPVPDLHSASRPTSPAHSRSSSRTRFTGRIELPLTPVSPGAPIGNANDQQALVKRVVELERAYQQLAREFSRVEREKEHYKALATPGGLAAMSRSESISPRNLSPTSSRGASRPPSPARGLHPLHSSHKHSHSTSSLSALTGQDYKFGPTGATISRPATSMGRRPSAGVLQMTTSHASGIVRPATGFGRW